MSSVNLTPATRLSENELQPLTREEVDLLARLLRDPTLFPREFKRWVTDHASDTVDIAKSQVHGLVDSAGSVIIPPPPLVSQIKFKALNYLVSIVSGSGATIISELGVECDGNPVIVEFYAPFVQYQHMRFNLVLDATPQAWLAEYKADAVAPDNTPAANMVARSSIYLQRQFTPSKGPHDFRLDALSMGVGILGYVGGGGTFFANTYADGFLRISRA